LTLVIGRLPANLRISDGDWDLEHSIWKQEIEIGQAIFRAVGELWAGPEMPNGNSKG